MKSCRIKAALWGYNLAWSVAIPFLKFNRRIKQGFELRTLNSGFEAADIWIQAASAGEAYLALTLLKNFHPSHHVRVLITTNTSQGMEILKKAVDYFSISDKKFSLNASYAPFDKPEIMRKAVKKIRPKIMVLLETEIWPGNLAALKETGCRIFIINGRITEKSMKGYMIWPSLWRALKPDKILAISKEDAKRFALLFDTKEVKVMHNLKFNRIGVSEPVSCSKNILAKIIHPDTSFVVFGSVRQEEEVMVEKIIAQFFFRKPETVIGLFPRHMHRIKYWKEALSRLNMPWVLRSEIDDFVDNGKIILWDRFGELALSYELCRAAFVGGSLAPLGGQNFLEALTSGVVPVIGPFWENFAWVGKEIISHGLIKVAADYTQVADLLIKNLSRKISHDQGNFFFMKVCFRNQSGADAACEMLENSLKLI